MKFAYNVPGYVCGHRFSQDRRYYDSANTRFLDLAGYNRFKNYCDKTAGTATFSNHGTYNREGLKLDNSNQWQFVNPIPWEGTLLVVAKGHVPTANQLLWPWLHGDATIASSNGAVALQTDVSSNLTTSAISPSAVVAAGSVAQTQDAIFLQCYAFDQETRKGYNSKDGVTVNETAAAAGTANGKALALGCNGNVGLTGTIGARMVRMGNNSGTVGDVAANATNYAYVFEQHYFKGNTLRNQLAAMKEFIDTLKAYYGIA